jgi:predicted metal-dependent RNase
LERVLWVVWLRQVVLCRALVLAGAVERVRVEVQDLEPAGSRVAVPVRAAVSQLEGFSGHADADGLLAWLRQLPAAPRQTYVVHGEPDAADALRARIQHQLGWAVRVPQHQETVTP